jgi:NADH:ubiquinone oxidoreductase subunit 5 (subunit L)/multisubunit Na+/H+ antiporter MnhA subunit
MADDKRYSRFFAYLGLFCFSMLGLLLSNNLIQLFVFWELVGICSYLLIGFWFEKRGPATASKKAVITNRVGDICFLLGVGVLVMQVGLSNLTMYNDNGTPALAPAVEASFGAKHAGEAAEEVGISGASEESIPAKFAAMAAPAAEGNFLRDNLGSKWLGLSWLTWAGLLLFGGAVAKSAQFPLHVWLPDAMEGPTPVSALIHAATMVAAGVYLMARLFPILTFDVRLVVAIIGCTTLTIGALTAVVQTDLKRVLAYSTISQLGFMMLFIGCGGYVAGLFHLVTHGFFKACLFLGAGSVIHAMHHEQDMRQMGGLWRKIPLTAATFLVSVAAIAGVPWFSGYYSKDLGLATVWDFTQSFPEASRQWAMVLYWLPVATAYLTAFYMMRAWWLTFMGKPRNEEKFEHAHESTTMTLPLLVLALLALMAGWGGILQAVIANSAPTMPANVYAEGGWVPQLTGETKTAAVISHATKEAIEHLELGEAAVYRNLYWGWAISWLAAILIYWNGFRVSEKIRRLPGMNLIYVWLRERMFFDYLYEWTVVLGAKVISTVAGMFDKWVVDGLVNLAGALTRLAGVISGEVDAKIVDGAVNGAAELAQAGGRAVLAPQTGRIRFYMLSMLTVAGTAAAVLGIVMMVRG